ncbi:TPA: hypothetical protein DD394_07740 [bacterium UBP9_UBA11836]|nr:hypothetical protein [bacterium UBP9_UBA11836]
MYKPEVAKVAVSVAVSPEDGATKVVSSAVGQKAVEMVEQAEKEGLSVTQDPQLVGELLKEQGNKAAISPQLYELMATVLDFTQELSDLKAGRFAQEPDQE